MKDEIKKKSKEEAARLFKLFRDNNTLLHSNGREYVGLKEDGLEAVIYSAMVDGAEIAVNKLKAK